MGICGDVVMGVMTHSTSYAKDFYNKSFSTVHWSANQSKHNCMHRSFFDGEDPSNG